MQKNCEIFTTPGLVLLHVMMQPGCTAAMVARELSLGLRTCRGALSLLKANGLITTERSGRHLTYHVNDAGVVATTFGVEFAVDEVFRIESVLQVARVQAARKRDRTSSSPALRAALTSAPRASHRPPARG